MYSLNLSESHAPATPEGSILEHSVGSLLAEQATRNSTQTALQEVCQDGSLGRAWTYTELHDDARRLASWLSERYADCAEKAALDSAAGTNPRAATIAEIRELTETAIAGGR